MEKHNAPSPGTFIMGRIRGSNNVPIKFTAPSPNKSWLITKNGNKEGNTLFIHNSNPFLDASSISSGNKIIKTSSKPIIAGRKKSCEIFLIFIYNHP
ncbi:MAG: hypothetical protein QME46_06480 [Thermoanaerobacteraceae bacterium]|nr:hypothetical protein [Thermoanaerobacteraceae bacterium]